MEGRICNSCTIWPKSLRRTLQAHVERYISTVAGFHDGSYCFLGGLHAVDGRPRGVEFGLSLLRIRLLSSLLFCNFWSESNGNKTYQKKFSINRSSLNCIIHDPFDNCRHATIDSVHYALETVIYARGGLHFWKYKPEQQLTGQKHVKYLVGFS